MNRIAIIFVGFALSLRGQKPADAASSTLDDKLYRSQMSAAHYALDLADYPATRAWLEETEPTARGFEWNLLHSRLDDSLRSWDTGTDVVTALATSPDGAWLACGTNSGKLVLRAASDGQVVKEIAAHDAEISQVRFDRNSARLVTTSHDRKVRIFTMPNLERLIDFTKHGYPVGGADFNGDGSLIASCSYERTDAKVVGTVHIWKADDGSVVRTLTGGAKPLVNLEFSPDGRQFASPSWDFCLFSWSIEGGEARKYPIPDEGIYNAADGVAWSPDGQWIAAGSQDKTARIFRAANGELVATLRGHRDAVAKLRFSPNGETLATASRDGTLRLWNTATWKLGIELRGPADDVVNLAFSADGQRLYAASQDRRLWEFAAACPWYADRPMQAEIAAYVCRFSPDGGRLATCSYNGQVQIWCAETQEQLARIAAHDPSKSCHMLEWSTDGSHLITGSYDQTIRVFDALLLTEKNRYTHDRSFYWMRQSPDGKRIAACSDKAVVVLSYPALERERLLEGHTAGILSVSFSADSTRCISTARDGTARIWELNSGKTLATIEAPRKDVAEACFLPGDERVLVLMRNGRVREHRAVDGALVREVLAHRSGADHFALSPDGRRLVLSSDRLTMVDVATGGIVGWTHPHLDRSYHAAWDATGSRLASVSTDKSVAILDPRPLRERLQDRDRALKLRADAEGGLAERFEHSDTLEQIVAEERASTAPEDARRAAWRAAITREAARRLDANR